MTQDEPEQDGEAFNDYALVSGYYGPGAIICWYLTLTAALLEILHCQFHKVRLKLSPDFIAATLYPIIASIHLLHQICVFPRGFKPYLIANLFNALSSNTLGPVLPSEVSSSKNYIDDTSSTYHKDLFPKIAAMGPALRIVDIFTYLCFWCFVLTLNKRVRNWLRTAMIVASFILCWIVRAIFIIRFWGDRAGSSGTSASDFIFKSVLIQGSVPLFLMFVVTYIFIASIVIPLSCMRDWKLRRRANRATEETGPVDTQHRRSPARGQPVPYSDYLTLLLIYVGVLLTSFGCFLFIRGLEFAQLFIPRSGISVLELDQTAAIVGGSLVLISAVHQAGKPPVRSNAQSPSWAIPLMRMDV